MSNLLGSQDCVESLRRDVIDLQGALVEVLSRTGPVRFRSWKFPDKESCDLDLVQLLGQYDYVEGEMEFNQHSHIVLLELVIDRLLLLLQSFNAYTEQMLGAQRARDCGKAGGSVCVGLVVKRYWSNLIHFSSQARQQSSTSSSTDPLTCSSSSQHSAPSSSPSRSLYMPPTPFVRSRSVSTQTKESALVPCDACAGVQAALQDVARAMASLCQALGLSCSVWSFLQAMEETLQLGRLSACDLCLWACEQQRDLGRIQIRVTDVQEKVDVLTHSLWKAEEERDGLRAQIERERETSKREREESRKREAEWPMKLQEEQHRRDEEIKRQREVQEELRRGTSVLEVKISELRGEVELSRETQQFLEHEKDFLVNEVHRFRLEEVRWKEAEEKKRNMEMDLRDTQKCLDKERDKYHSIQRQHEAMVVKQHALLERLGVLVQQSEELQSHLEASEDEKAKLTDTLTHTMLERNTLQEQLTQQKSEFLSVDEDRQKQCVRLQELQQCVSKLTEDLQQAEERERILVAFPDLNPQNTTPQSTGDVLCDMEQQVMVNLMRIRLLEQQNASLTKTLTKLKLTQTLSSSGDHTPSTDLGRSEVDRRDKGKEKQIISSASSSVLHHQMLSLSVAPDTEETYTKLRQAASTRSAKMNRRGK